MPELQQPVQFHSTLPLVVEGRLLEQSIGVNCFEIMQVAKILNLVLYHHQSRSMVFYLLSTHFQSLLHVILQQTHHSLEVLYFL